MPTQRSFSGRKRQIEVDFLPHPSRRNLEPTYLPTYLPTWARVNQQHPSSVHHGG